MFPMLAGVLTILTTTAMAQGDGKLVWATDLGKARTLATEQNKPLLLLFRCER